MTRPAADVVRVRELRASGLSQAETARRAGVPRSTVRGGLRRGIDEVVAARAADTDACATCRLRADALADVYAYLLGMYLGDGHISPMPRGVYRLRITCDRKYPGIISECRGAMAAVSRNPVGVVPRQGCIDLASYSKHWPCLFPQHGPGSKHLRAIVLETWQEEIVARYPEPLLRGLLHSDGCRVLNHVKGTPYPRYFFSNVSTDIQAIFCQACDSLGLSWRHNRWNSLSIARRHDVARLDRFVGPKT